MASFSAAAGDSIVLERRGHDRTKLYVTVVKASEAAPAEEGPKPKKRRVLEEAVQHLA